MEKREIKTHIVLASGYQGSGKSSLQLCLKAAAKPKYAKIWDLNFADPIYEIHNFIQNKIYSFHDQYGLENTIYKLPDILHDYIFNKMAGWGENFPASDKDLLIFLKKYVAIKIALNNIEPSPKDGDLLQYLGTEFGRKKFGDNVWVDILKKKVIKIPGYGTEDLLVIVGDCRFENEFDSLPEAFRIRLECPEEIRKTRTNSWRENTQHPSEIGLDRYAQMGIFDMYANTSPQGISPEGIASLVMAKLGKGNWVEKRYGIPVPAKEKNESN